MNALNTFFESNSTGMRFARTVVQGLLAALCVFVPTAVGYLNLTPEAASFMTACIMAVLAPLMSLLKRGESITPDEEVVADAPSDC